MFDRPPLDSCLPAPVEAARASVADPDHWALPYAMVVRGLADYRTGNFQGARDWCQRALEKPVAWQVKANACLVLAVSGWRLGQIQDAQTTIGRVTAILNAEAGNFTGGNLGQDWPDRLFSQALLQEAEAMLETRMSQVPASL